MKKLLLGLLLVTGLAANSAAGPVPTSCPNCIFNTAAPQTAEANVGTWTVRGTITATTGYFQYINLQNLTVTNILGDGSGLTNLNASQLLFGTIPSGRLTGAYPGITGVGTITSGVWHGTPIATQYGGSGQDFSTTNQGSLIYFSATGVETTLAPGPAGYLLQTNGAAQNPTYTNSPQILGSNITAIPLTALQAGTLPTNITVLDASIATVSGAKVTGNIPGGAATLTAPLPISGIQPGTLPTTIAASSITDTGVTPGVYGNPGYVPQITVRSDGRLNVATQLQIAIDPSQINAGLLPGGVTVNPSAINAGTLGVGVVAQTLTNTGVAAGTYGSPTLSAQITVDAQGRITSAAQFPIPGLSTSSVVNNVDNAWQHSQTMLAGSSWTINGDMLVTGMLTAGFFVGNGAGITNISPANISAGVLPANVIASSVGANGITPGSCGDATHSCTITFTADGRATFQSQVSITGIPAGSVAAENVLPGFLNPGVKLSTANVVPGFNGANEFVQMDASGHLPAISGQNITNISPANLSAGTLPANVIASSVAATGVTAGAYGSATQVGAFTVGGDGRLSAAANITITPAAASITPGTLGASVIASSVGANGVSPGTCGDGTHSCSLTITADGRITVQSNVSITGSSPGGAAGGVLAGTYPNPTFGPQVVLSTHIANGAVGDAQTNLSTNAIVSGTFGDGRVAITTGAVTSGKFGDNRVAISTGAFITGFNGANQLVQLNGSGAFTALSGANLTNLTPANISAGTLGPAVIASSVAATGVMAGTYGDSSHVAQFTVGGDGRLSSASNVALTGSTGISSTCASGFYLDNESVTSGQVRGGSCVAVPTGATPFWTKYTVAYTALSAASTTNDVQLALLTARQVLMGVVIKQSTAFSGGSISAYTISVGITGNLTKYASAFDVFQSVGSGVAQISNSGYVEDFTSSTSIRIAAISTGDTLNNATAGSVDIWILATTLP